MKKILLTAAMMLVGLTMSATKYIGTISVSINGEGGSQEATVGLVEQNGKYTLSIKNFMLGEDTPVGNVILTDLTPTDNADGSKSLSYSGVIMIPAGDDPRFAEEEWLGPMLNDLGGVPVVLTATFTDSELTCHIDIDMSNTLEQKIKVDFSSYPTNVYNGKLTVKINEEVSTQEASVKILNNNGKYTLAIFNFMLGEDTPVGDITLRNLEATTDASGKKVITFSGTVMIPAGDDPRFAEDEWIGLMLNELGGVPVTMTATFNDTDLTCHIDIDMRNTLQQMIEVDFTTENGSEVKPGDVNGDGEVNVSDVVALANFAMGETPEGFVKEAGDLNNDGEMNVSDVVILANKVMG